MIRYLEHGVHDVDNYRVECIGWGDKSAFVLVDNTEHVLKTYFRYERTWDDHMGNTPCGYYVILPLPNGRRVRAYMG